MKDLILEKFFESERWEYAIDKGVGKDISKAQLYQLTKPEVRALMYQAIKEERYEIAPPHTAKIPKDGGGHRIVYINEPIDRIFLSIANDLLFELAPGMVHERCVSYQKGIGCGKIVKDVSHQICGAEGSIIGWKSDLSKYFDSVPIRFIDEVFDAVEFEFGESKVITVLRKYYHSDYCFDIEGNLVEHYQSLKQGCSVASWLANCILWHIDEHLSHMQGYYVRYSDDMLYIGPDYAEAMDFLTKALASMDMSLNPKKVEYLSQDQWFKFLGYSIKGGMISLSSTRLKKFQHEIESRTIKKRGTTLKKAVNAVNRFLYKGYDNHSWATQILPVCNVTKDINELNKFVMDCLKAVATGKTRVGGLGYVVHQKDGCVQRGKGRNVRSNRTKVEHLDGYLTLVCMQNVLKTSREAYKTLVEGL